MTVYARGVDYAWTHPNPDAVKAAGYSFACRYFSRDSSKNLALAEAQALAARDIWCVANWEYGAQDALRGFAGGVADATLALQQATAAGMPAGRPIYFSVDWDVTPAQEASVTAYLQGADSVLGLSRTGEYGGFYPLKVQRDDGVSSWEWQTTAWSGGQWESRVNIEQTGSATVGGVQVDVNEAMTPDFGQWMPGRLPAAAPEPPPAPDPDLYVMETSMFPQIESLVSDSRSAGSKGQYAYGMGALGGQGSITFSADGGLNGNAAAAELRVVCWNDSGYHISNIEVGYPGEHRAQVMFPTDSPVYAVTVSRSDDGDFPVGVAVP